MSGIEASLKLLESNDAATQASTRKLLIKALGNLAGDPGNEKFRQLRTTNKTIDAKIMQVRGAVQVLQMAGFRQQGEFLVVTNPDAAAVGAAARAACEALEKADGGYVALEACLAHRACVRGVAIAEDGAIATGALDNVVRLWDASGLLQQELRGHEKPKASDGGVTAVGFLPGGQVASVARDGAIMAFERDASAAHRHVGHGEVMAGEARPTNAQIISSVCVADGLVLTGSWDKTVISWDVGGDKPAVRFGPFGQAVNGLAYEDGLCACAIADGVLAGLDPRAPPASAVRWTNDATLGTPLRGAAVAAGHFATASNDGIVRLWEPKTGRLVRGAVAGTEGYLFAVAGDAQAVYAGGDDGIVTKWAAPSLAVLMRIPQPAAVWALAVKGPSLLVGLDDHHGALLWTTDPKRALPGQMAVSVVATCHEAAAAAKALPPSVPTLEGDAAKAKTHDQARQNAGGDVSMGGTAPLPPNPNYDFSFPVELTGRPGLQINWNQGDDPNMVAIKFCDDNGIPKNQLGDVVVFVQQAMGSVPQQQAAAPAPQTTLTDAQKADMVAQVVALGVDVTQAYAALEKTNYASVELAINSIFGN